KFSSGTDLTPRQLHAMLDGKLDDWKYDAVSVGFPAPVRNGRILTDPKNLGKGWTRFNFEKAFGKPVRVINDAAMQALGSYAGRRRTWSQSQRLSRRRARLARSRPHAPPKVDDFVRKNGYSNVVGRPFLAAIDSRWQAGTPALQFSRLGS